VHDCAQMPSLMSFVDTSDCAGTVQTVVSASPSFSNACQNGNLCPDGGAGGSGGSGGSGG